MANGFTLDSEQLQQSPQQQQLAAQQPMPAQGQGFNLLSFLGDVGKGLLEGIAETGAYYAASQGRPQLLQQMQQQKQQQQLEDQFKNLSPKDLEGPFGQILQRQLQFGDIEGAKKTLINKPKWDQTQELFKNPKLGLEQSEVDALQTLAAVDPENALALTRRLVGISREKKGQMAVEAQKEELRRQREERLAGRKAAQTPAAVIAEATRKGRLTAENAEKALPGILRGAGIKVPTNPAERQVFLQDFLQDPALQLVPAKTRSGIFNWFSKEPTAAPTTAAPQLPGAVRKFNPATGRLE